MAHIVCKFGGTSVADVKLIKMNAQRIKQRVDDGESIAVVVSAMSGMTDQLIEWATEIAPLHDPHEHDVVISSGEQVSVGLFALALQELGVSARSWLAWQLPIRTDGIHSNARIQAFEIEAIEQRLAEREVPVVAGFQGRSAKDRVTTLGRGGSDITAVALASALNAERCDIYTDVEGVFTADPRIVAKARKLDRIAYEEMLEMASQGAKVLHTRSVELAMSEGVRLQVLSSFTDTPGTLVVDEDEIMEQAVVSGIAYSRDEAKITLLNIADRPGIAAGIFGPLAESAINVDMIVQSASEDGQSTDLTFTLARLDLERAVEVLQAQRDAIGYKAIQSDANVAKISVIGVGMRSHAGVAARMFSVLAERGINIQVISTSEIKVSVLVSEEYAELAIRALHSTYGLDAHDND